VTLCIAAECEYAGRPAIAMCADWRAQTGNIAEPETMIGTEGAYKLREFRRATVMLAGDHRAAELAIACKTAIRDFTENAYEPNDVDIHINEFMSKIRLITDKRKMEMKQRVAVDLTGMNHSEFVKLPREQFPDVWNAIQRTNLGADILICCVLSEPIIIRVDQWGEPHWEHNYSVIGSGASVARALLCLQMWTPRAVHHASVQYKYELPPLEECAFRIAEAHFASHMASPSNVGENTTYQVLTAKHRASINAPVISRLAQAILVKHQVPEIETQRAKNSVLHCFQELSTGTITEQEPDEV